MTSMACPWSCLFFPQELTERTLLSTGLSSDFGRKLTRLRGWKLGLNYGGKLEECSFAESYLGMKSEKRNPAKGTPSSAARNTERTRREAVPH